MSAVADRKKIRLFIAVALSPAIKKVLGELIGGLKSSKYEVKWADGDKPHLTLKFIGYVDKEKVRPIIDEIGKCVALYKPFRMCLLLDIEAFPNKENPRVLWLGIKDGNEELKKLQADMERRLEDIGIKKEERKFTPHLTLGRVKSSKGKKLLVEKIKKAGLDKHCGMKVSKITLFESTLTRTGAFHEVLYEAKL
ncbi:MAG: RNA 2',3'-cyclic phosphodiesterase [Candidatus Omnitrophica bacterium]|nr:RNA 2',3'-cyclic phosphodiesterase [Candidatus Omnitrophota bacterium]